MTCADLDNPLNPARLHGGADSVVTRRGAEQSLADLRLHNDCDSGDCVACAANDTHSDAANEHLATPLFHKFLVEVRPDQEMREFVESWLELSRTAGPLQELTFFCGTGLTAVLTLSGASRAMPLPGDAPAPKGGR